MEEPMTDYQFKSIVKMVLLILQDAESKEEAVKKLEELIGE